MSNWLANMTGVHVSPHGSHFDRDQFGNLLKNAAPVAGMFMGGPLGAALAGGLGSAAGRGMQHGANLGNILGQGALGAGIAGAGNGGMHALQAAFSPSSAAGAASSGFGAAPGGGWQAYGAQALGNPDPGVLSKLGSGIGSAASGIGHFAASNPMATAQGLQGIAQIPQMGSENRLRNAQANQMEQQAGESAYDFQTRKARDAALEPLRRALMAQIGQSFTPGQSFGG